MANKDSTTTTVLGYQIRVPVIQLPPLWTPQRRAQYLLLPTVGVPLSADTGVWPVADDPDLPERIFEDFEPGPYEAPNGLGLFRLKKDFTVELVPLKPDNPQVVGIGVEKQVASRLAKKHFIVTSESDAIIGEQHIHLLGFDVCDDILLSGLMNCGISADHHAKLRRKYAGSINMHGLFDVAEGANEYAADVSQIVPEHAPFFPVSIFSV